MKWSPRPHHCALFFGIGTSKLDNSRSVYVSHDIQMPRIGIGTAGMGRNTKDATCTALNEGVRLIDSAQAVEWYSERDVGAAIRECYSEEFQTPLVVVTKIHPRSYRLDPMRISLEKSMMDLYGHRRKLDVALLHAPFCWGGHCTPEEAQYSWINAWKNLERLHSEGTVAAIGVSNFHVDQLRDLLEIANTRVAVVQNWMDPFRQDSEVRALCREFGIVYMAYSSMGYQWAYIDGVNRNPVLEDPTLTSVAKKHNTTVASVVYTWVLELGGIAIPKSTNAHHIRSNAGLLDINKVHLDEFDMKLIQMLDGTLGKY